MVANGKIVSTWILCIHDIPNFSYFFDISRLPVLSASFWKFSQITKKFPIFLMRKSAHDGPAQFMSVLFKSQSHLLEIQEQAVGLVRTRYVCNISVHLNLF